MSITNFSVQKSLMLLSSIYTTSMHSIPEPLTGIHQQYALTLIKCAQSDNRVLLPQFLDQLPSSLTPEERTAIFLFATHNRISALWHAAQKGRPDHVEALLHNAFSSSASPRHIKQLLSFIPENEETIFFAAAQYRLSQPNPFVHTTLARRTHTMHVLLNTALHVDMSLAEIDILLRHHNVQNKNALDIAAPETRHAIEEFFHEHASPVTPS